MSGGGTAGHIYPALAAADRFTFDGHDVTFYGTPQGLESKLVPEAGVAFVPIEAHGFDRSRPLTLLTSTAGVLRSALIARRHFRFTRPDVVVGFGGYVSIPVGLAASWCGVPLVLHEQNAVPGLTNKFLSRRAQTVCITYPETATAVSGGGARVVATGNPVRASVLEGRREDGLALIGIDDPDAVVLLVFGGSRGAKHLNSAVGALGARLLAVNPKVHVVHATGPVEFEAVLGALDQGVRDSGRYHVLPYIDRMGDVMAAASLAVCRAGATTIAELTAIGLGAVLVPYPFATDDHQTKNAQAMVASGAALAFADHDLDGDGFGRAILSLLGDANTRDTMSRASRALGRPDAAAELADAIYRTAGRVG